jgi:hypothetical protein
VRRCCARCAASMRRQVTAGGFGWAGSEMAYSSRQRVAVVPSSAQTCVRSCTGSAPAARWNASVIVDALLADGASAEIGLDLKGRDVIGHLAFAWRETRVDLETALKYARRLRLMRL